MNLRLRSIESRDEAEVLLPMLERAVFETSRALHEDADEAAAARDARAYLEHRFGRPGALLLVGEAEGATRAVCASAPFSDPLTGALRPMLVVLWVDRELRHRGVARALVVELRRLLAQAGHPVLTARAGVGDDAILSMGERWGLVRAWEFLSGE